MLLYTDMVERQPWVHAATTKPLFTAEHGRTLHHGYYGHTGIQRECPPRC